MKTAMISMFVLFAFISVSSFALPGTDIICLLDCGDVFDLCDQVCVGDACDVCVSDLELCRDAC